MAVPFVVALLGCFKIAPSDGGGVEDPPRQRLTDAADVLVPDGFTVEVVATGLDLPTGLTFDDGGRPCVTEAGYSYGELFRTPRLVCLEPDGTREVVATGDNPPWNGVTFHDGAFWVAEGGVLEGGRILRITPDGAVEIRVEGLPSLGDHHTNGPAVGPDGFVYFGQGTATNSGVVGPDNLAFGWLPRHPDFHDTPCRDVTLAGENYTTEDLLDGEGVQVTGAFVPYGTRTEPGQVIPGALPCNGAIMRVPVAGGPLELVAWGLRNPYGLTFAPDGALYVTDNGFDVRGSRPVFGAADHLLRIEPGTWYGWPDHAADRPVTDDRFEPPGADDPPAALLAEAPGEPPAPLARLGVHGAAVGLAVAPDGPFDGPFGSPLGSPVGGPVGGTGTAYVAMFGDMAPGVGKVLNPVGYRVLRVDLGTGVQQTFAANAGDRVGPATWQGTRGLERPIDVAFADDDTLYLLDFGILGTSDSPLPVPETGVLWRITAEAAPVAASEAP